MFLLCMPAMELTQISTCSFQHQAKATTHAQRLLCMCIGGLLFWIVSWRLIKDLSDSGAGCLHVCCCLREFRDCSRHDWRMRPLRFGDASAVSLEVVRCWFEFSFGMCSWYRLLISHYLPYGTVVGGGVVLIMHAGLRFNACMQTSSFGNPFCGNVSDMLFLIISIGAHGSRFHTCLIWRLYIQHAVRPSNCPAVTLSGRHAVRPSYFNMSIRRNDFVLCA